MTETLDDLLKRAAAAVKAMSPTEYAAMVEAQRRSWVHAEMSWPAPKFQWINGVKTYDSYEDYCNG